MAKKKKNKKNIINVNMSGVEGSNKIPNGQYDIVVDKAVIEQTQNGDDMIVWAFKVNEGAYEGRKLTDRSVIKDNCLWSLRNILEAMGQEIPDDEMEIDLDSLIGEELSVCVEQVQSDRDKKFYSTIVEYVLPGEDDGDNDSDGGSDYDPDVVDEIMAMNAKKLGRFIKKEDLDVDLSECEKLADKREAVAAAYRGEEDGDGDGDGESLTEDEINEMDEDELDDVIDDNDLDVDLSEVKGKGKKKLAKQRQAVIDAAEDAGILGEEDGDGDGDGDITKEDIMDMEEDDLEEFIEDNDLEVNFKKLKTLRKKRKVVVEAAEDADVI